MGILEDLKARADNSCELCKSKDDLSVYEVAPSDDTANTAVLLCKNCKEQLEDKKEFDETHWHCLNDSMWSSIPAVQVLAYRILKKLNNQELLDMLYLDEDSLKWANSTLDENKIVHKDCNGVVLNAGDTVTIIKDLDVKGANFTAKRGTAVRNISLTSNPEHIEGRVNDVKIVILTQYVKKS